jgi:multicomponent Na+:H+ antiporter subunit G
MQDVVANVLVVLGTIIIGGAAIGMVRLPDVYSRINAVAKAAALGVSLILAGIAVLEPSPQRIVIIALAIAAQLFTAPIAGYAVGRAAYRSGATLTASTRRDDLANQREG